MKEFYCNKCKKDVVLEDGKCPLCNTNWNKVLTEVNSKEIISKYSIVEEQAMSNETSLEEEIDKVVNFYIMAANKGKNVFGILASILLIITLLYAFLGEGDDMFHTILIIIFLISSVLIVLYGFIFENRMKWKAYMLKTNLEILSKK